MSQTDSTTPPRPAGMPEPEWLARLQLAACYRLFDWLGWAELIFNHITVRVAGPGDTPCYLINPFGLHYAEVTARNLIKVRLDGSAVETIEGVSDSGEIRDLQDAFIARNAAQCGYCTPGMLMTVADLLRHSAKPTRAQIRDAISGNYCRCTGYHAIVDAVETVAQQRAAKS